MGMASTGGLGDRTSIDTNHEQPPQRPVCTYASGCDCDVPRPLPQGNKAWHCPKQQEHAAKVWNSISVAQRAGASPVADFEQELSDDLWAWLVDEDGRLRAAGFNINEWTDRPAAGCDCDACAKFYDGACLKCGGKATDCPYLPKHCPSGVTTDEGSRK